MILGLWLWQQRQCIASAVRQAALWLLVVGCLIGLPWIAYGILTSGYPLFPSTIGALTVDYRIPADITTDAANWVLAYARNPRGDEAATLRGWDWLKSWWSMMRDSFDQFLFVIPLAASVILLAAYGLLSAILGLIGKSPPRDGWRWLPLLPALVSVVFWFLTAPDPRFAGAAFWILALWTGIMLVSLLRQIRPPAIVVRASIAAPAGVALVLVALGISAGFRLYGNGFPPLPHAPMKTYQTDSGLIVNIPANANNPLQLWDAPLPASPYTLPHLELRGSDLRSGFRMNDP
ncbi:MAG TPA: hypothetical protein VMT34_01810, partial [Aggregatilineales bacterium]|nr:hypothetical protein [Aggregatilineales bacterium]